MFLCTRDLLQKETSHVQIRSFSNNKTTFEKLIKYYAF